MIARDVKHPSIPAVVAALAISWASMLVHNLFELPISPLDAPNTGPLLVVVALGIGYRLRLRSAIVGLLMFVWAVLNLIGGGIITVLPVPFLPFVPEQSLGHYLAHVVYSVGQLPLIAVGWLAGRPARSRFR